MIVLVFPGISSASSGDGQNANLNPANPQLGECGMRLTEASAEIAATNAGLGLNEMPAGPRFGTEYVPVAFHVVRRSDGSDGISASDLCSAWDNLRTSGLGGSQLEFYLVGPIDYIDDDYYYNDVDSNEAVNLLRQENPRCNAINIYLTGDLFNFGLQGTSSFTFMPYQGIVILNGSAPYSTTPHEVGHYFDLFHTHENRDRSRMRGWVELRLGGRSGLRHGSRSATK